MGSLKGASVVVAAIAMLVPVVSWIVDRAGAFAKAGATLSLGWRLAIAATNWYVRFLPFIAVGGVALAAIVGGYLSRRCPPRQERRALLGWLVVALLYVCLPLLASLVPNLGSHIRLNWIHGLTALMAVGIVAPVATVLVGAHLQARIRTSSGSRVRGWHVAIGSLALAAAGPAFLIPPLWVWVRAGSVSTASEAP